MISLFRMFLLSTMLFNNYGIVEKEVNSDKIIYVDEYLTVYQDEGYSLYFGNTLVNIMANTLQIVVKEDVVSIVYHDGGYLYYNQYQLNGELISSQIITNEEFDEFSIDYYRGSLYIAGTISQYREFETDKQMDKKDAILIRVSNEIEYQLYGGEYNETFKTVNVNDDGIYVTGIKDKKANGDFIGGTYEEVFYVALLNNDLELVKYNTINYPTTSIYSSNLTNVLTVITDGFICSVDNDLQIESQKVKAEWGHVGREFSALYDGDNIEIYDKKLAFETEIPFEKEIVRTVGKAILTKKDTICLIDIIDNDSLIVLDDYIYNVQPPEMTTLFGKAAYKEKYSEPYFDALIWGKYLFTYTFNTSGNITYEIKKEQTVQLEYNVIQGGVYPLNYCLRYTGIAKLNGNMIFNNHAITKPGDYTLELTSYQGDVKVITFTVALNQFAFNDIIFKKYDVEVQKNQPYNISFNIEAENINIDSIVIDGNQYTDFTYDNGVLVVTLPPQERPGIVNHIIEGINYSCNDQRYYYNVNEPYYVNVLSASPYVSMVYEETEKSKIIIDCIDLDNTLRHFVLRVTNGSVEKNLNIPLGNGEVVFEELEAGDYSGVLYLLYNVGVGIERFIEIGKISFMSTGNNVLGKIAIVSSSTTINKVELEFANSFKTNQLTNLTVDKNIVYQGSGYNFMEYVKYGVIVAIISAIFIYSLRIIKKRKVFR